MTASPAPLIGIKPTCTIPEKMRAQAILAERGLTGLRYPRRMVDVPAVIREFFEEVAVAPKDDVTVAIEQSYEQALALVAQADPRPDARLPSLDELKATITDTIDGEELQFSTFALFYSWWDVVTAYDGMDVEDSNEAYRPLLELAYAALVHDGVINA
ncbi:hypothetical protein Q1Z72_01465 [Pseudomonas qingdaonensis]|uniref:hypothetical protein n=1 Tax=Pseudomonas TaxID=286 RepID=UPI00211751B3|nr:MULTISPECIES: hypothetical protein [Pseudomonas]UXH55934.1 hypothetical protein N5876_32825 [Pseudomonas aeruginosa]UXH68978.1 hypothetical protein N5879_32265 [Pseudomonas aeruginosa]WKL67363.1 hypothetical protein Q1Z72_01465 [Pseudomonas qingdaonensis]